MINLKGGDLRKPIPTTSTPGAVKVVKHPFRFENGSSATKLRCSINSGEVRFNHSCARLFYELNAVQDDKFYTFGCSSWIGGKISGTTNGGLTWQNRIARWAIAVDAVLLLSLCGTSCLSCWNYILTLISLGYHCTSSPLHIWRPVHTYAQYHSK